MDLPTLSEPLALLWLVPLLPLLWWLAQPPRPKQIVVTAHHAQWLRALASLRRRPPRMSTWRLLLLLLAVLAIGVAAAGPVTSAVVGPDRLLVLLDGSASMAAGLPGQPSAHERAVAAVRAGLQDVPEEVGPPGVGGIEFLRAAVGEHRRAAERVAVVDDPRLTEAVRESRWGDPRVLERGRKDGTSPREMFADLRLDIGQVGPRERGVDGVRRCGAVASDRRARTPSGVGSRGGVAATKGKE